MSTTLFSVQHAKGSGETQGRFPAHVPPGPVGVLYQHAHIASSLHMQIEQIESTYKRITPNDVTLQRAAVTSHHQFASVHRMRCQLAFQNDR